MTDSRVRLLSYWFAWWPCTVTLAICLSIVLFGTDAMTRMVNSDHRPAQIRMSDDQWTDPSTYLDRAVPLPDDAQELMAGNVGNPLHSSQPADATVGGSPPDSFELLAHAAVPSQADSPIRNADDTSRPTGWMKSR